MKKIILTTATFGFAMLLGASSVYASEMKGEMPMKSETMMKDAEMKASGEMMKSDNMKMASEKMMKADEMKMASDSAMKADNMQTSKPMAQSEKKKMKKAQK